MAKTPAQRYPTGRFSIELSNLADRWPAGVIPDSVK